MAMLAEPRSRKRYNLCPRGKALYEDDSRFGTKMLEKWGWEKGRGLGANEDGEQEFVRVRFKNDAEGLGFEARDDQWTTHEEGFNGLLKTLNGEESQANGAETESEDELRTVGFGFKTEPQTLSEDAPQKLKEKISGVSLEEKSKHSKARVHYKKFTRGKDLSQYSEKDLANIFGKKVNEELKKKEEPEEKEVNPNFSGVHTLSTGLSVQDYFKQKMEAIKKRLQNGGDQKEAKQLDESNDGDEKDGPQIQEETGLKKNRKYKKLEENGGLEEPVDAGTEEMVKKKKKSKKSKEIEEITEQLLVEPSKKKKKSKKSKEIQEEVIRTEEMEEICRKPEESVEKKQKSKKTKEITDEEVEMEEICKEPEESVEKKSKRTKETLKEAPLLEESLKKKKKSKKQKELELDIQEQVSEEPPIPEESNKKKSKKQKKLKLDSVIKVPEIQEPQETVVPTSEESYKKESKKQKILEIEQKLPEKPIPEVSFKKKSKKQTENNENQYQLPVEPQETVVPISEESFKKKSKKRKENIEQKQPEEPLETVEPLSEDVSKKKKKSENSITPSTTQKPSKKKRDFDTTDHLALEPALKKLKKSLDETLDQPTQSKNFI